MFGSLGQHKAKYPLPDGPSLRPIVLEAYTRDSLGKVARIDYDSMDYLRVKTGDPIIIEGKKTTSAKVLPLYPSDEGKNVIRLNQFVRLDVLRHTSKEWLDNTVTIRKLDVAPIDSLIIGPGYRHAFVWPDSAESESITTLRQFLARAFNLEWVEFETAKTVVEASSITLNGSHPLQAIEITRSDDQVIVKFQKDSQNVEKPLYIANLENEERVYYEESIPPLDEKYVTDNFMGFPLMEEDSIFVTYFGGSIKFNVVGMKFKENYHGYRAGVVTQDTLVHIVEGTLDYWKKVIY